MLRRRAVGRRMVRTAAVGGVAYGVGHHMATKSAQQAQTDAVQNAQIEDVQQQQQMPPPQPAYQQPPAPPPAPPSGGLSSDDITQLQQLGKLHEAGVLTDAEFEAAKQKILQI
jgi:Short C-terminal domain